MSVATENEKVRHSRKLVLELLGSSVDVDLAGPKLPDQTIPGYMDRYGADPSRFGPAGAPSRLGDRDSRQAGHHHATAADRGDVAQPVKVDNELFIRDYAKCILCYKCVEACGVDAQNTFAISVAGRGFDRDLHRVRHPARHVRLRVLRQLHQRLPDRRADVPVRVRDAPGWHLGRVGQQVVDTICPYCGVGCTLSFHVQDNRIVKVLSPLTRSRRATCA